MDPNDWLERQGLNKYAGLLAERAIDLDAELASRVSDSAVMASQLESLPDWARL